MRFLVLALCVAAASAASPWQQAGQVVGAAASVAAAPFVAAGKAAASVAGDAAAVVLRSESDVRPDGFSWTYETDNGISASSSGSLKKVDNVDTLVIQGEYTYASPDGTPVKLQYVADENGYQPSSDQLPVGPPVPAEIARALEYIAAHPPPPEPQRRN